MSHSWHYQCLSHTPALQSEEFTQHTQDEYFDQGVVLANSRPLADEYEDGFTNPARSHYERNARDFLTQHPNCRLQLISESGRLRSLADPGKDLTSLIEPNVQVIAGKVRLSHVHLSHSPESLVVTIDARTKYFDVSMMTGTFHPQYEREDMIQLEISLSVNQDTLRADEDANADTFIIVSIPQEEGWVFSVEGGGRYGARLIGVRQNALAVHEVVYLVED